MADTYGSVSGFGVGKYKIFTKKSLHIYEVIFNMFHGRERETRTHNPTLPKRVR